MLKLIVCSVPTIAFLLVSYFYTFTGFEESYYDVTVYEIDSKVEHSVKCSDREQIVEFKVCSKFDKLLLNQDALSCSNDGGNVRFKNSEYVEGYYMSTAVFISILYLLVVVFLTILIGILFDELTK